MKTTVVIPNFNGKIYLNACLESLQGAAEGEYAVLVVDNGSSDKSAEEAAERFPWLEMVSFPENRGFCAAVNEGIRRCRTPYVFLLNNDTVVRPGAIAALERRMDADPALFSLSACMVEMADPVRMDGAGDLYSALGWAYALGKGKPAERFRDFRYVFSACAGAALYRMEYLAVTGLFDEAHFAYLEDVDLGWRGRILGYRNGFEPAAVVLHAGSGSTGSRYNAFKITHSARNNIYLLYKNMPAVQLLLNLPFLLAGFGIKALFFARRGFGGLYLKALGEGLGMCRTGEAKKKKIRFKWNRLGYYSKIQLELWLNLFRRF